jgi:penicillin-binding protein 1A
MMEFLQAVTRIGTGAAAAQLKHPLGGKTGTTNDFTDAWFIGFSPSVTCGTWIGFDNRQSLGEKETGAKAALPMWMTFMRAAIANKPDEKFPESGAPKKQLEVPVTAEGETPQAKEPEAAPDEPDDSTEPQANGKPAEPQ